MIKIQLKWVADGVIDDQLILVEVIAGWFYLNKYISYSFFKEALLSPVINHVNSTYIYISNF